MNWLDEDPELLHAALEIMETWDGGNAGDSISVRSPLTDGSESANENHGGVVELDDSGSNSAYDSPIIAVGQEVSIHEPDGNGSLLVTMRLPPLEVEPLASKESVPSSVAARELKPSTLASSRHRQREEVIYLRGKVKEMEAQLALLDKTKQDASVSGTSSTDKALTIMWHDIASRQERMRKKVELDQAKLRKLLEMQMKVAEGLMKLMQKARRLGEDESYPTVKRMRVMAGPGLRLDEGHQLARVHAHYKNLDAAFSFPKFHDGSLKFVDVEVTDDAEEKVVIEYREAWTVPFEMDRVLDALWQYTLKRNEEKWCEPGYDATTTTRLDGMELVSRFAAKSTICGFTGCFNGQAIVKRFVGGAPAIITVTNTAPQPLDPGDIDDFYMHDDTFMRVLHFDEGAQGAGAKPITIVQCMQRFELQFEERAQKVRHRAGVLTNMILGKLKEDIELKHNTVETLLLCSRPR